MGDFLLGPSQGDVRAVFVPLERLQKDLNFTGRANLVLLSTQAPAESVGQWLRAVSAGRCGAAAASATEQR